MAKYLIEIDGKAENGLYKARAFNTLVFDQNGLDRLEKYEEPEQKKPKRWRAKKGENFWFVKTSGEVKEVTDYRWNEENYCYLTGNYFYTKEEAEDYKETLIVYNELKAYAEPDDAVWDGEKQHWCIKYNAVKKRIDVDFWVAYKREGLHFQTHEIAQAAIEAVGADCVKRFYLGIKED